MATRRRGTASGFSASAKPPNPELLTLQDDVSKAFRTQQTKFPFGAGVMLELEFTASTLTQSVAHKLDGSCSGFIVIDLDAPVTIHRQVPTSSTSSRTHVELVASGACNAKIWVWR